MGQCSWPPEICSIRLSLKSRALTDRERGGRTPVTVACAIKVGRLGKQFKVSGRGKAVDVLMIMGRAGWHWRGVSL